MELGFSGFGIIFATCDGTILAYSYYRLTKSFRDSSGKIRKRNVLCLGELDGYSKGEREELADMLTEMIENGQHIITDNPKLRKAALDFYLKYRESDYARENDPVLREEALRREREQRKDLITVHIDSLTQREARTIGPEALCHSTLKMLQIGKFLYAKGWSRDQVTLAMMQIIARSIYPYSELKTVRYLKENTALAELFKFSKVKITKDALYRSALRLWDVHRELEDGSTNAYATCSSWRRKYFFLTSPMPTLRAEWKTLTCAGSAAVKENATTARSWFSSRW